MLKHLFWVCYVSLCTSRCCCWDYGEARPVIASLDEAQSQSAQIYHETEGSEVQQVREQPQVHQAQVDTQPISEYLWIANGIISVTDENKNWRVYPVVDTSFLEILGQDFCKEEGMALEDFNNSSKTQGLLQLTDGKIVLIRHDLSIKDIRTDKTIISLEKLVPNQRSFETAETLDEAITSFEAYRSHYGQIREFDAIKNESELWFFGVPMVAILEDTKIKKLALRVGPGEIGYWINRVNASAVFEFKGKNLVFLGWATLETQLIHKILTYCALGPLKTKIDKYLVVDRVNFKQQISDFISEDETSSRDMSRTRLSLAIPKGGLAIVKIKSRLWQADTRDYLPIDKYYLIQKSRTGLFTIIPEAIDWNTFEVKEMPFKAHPDLEAPGSGNPDDILKAMGLPLTTLDTDPSLIEQ